MKQFEALSQEARSLLLNQYFGVLSTISQKVGGYPFGSVTPYSLHRNGEPVILISDIAQHTKNIEADTRVSLTILEHGVEDVQENPRLTILADATKLGDTDKDTANRYYSRFPQSQDYHSTHNFSFYRLTPVKIRYIGGFGKIHWLDPADFILASPFSQAEEQRIVKHINEDHQSALRHYLRHFKDIPIKGGQAVRMVSIDTEGFDVMVKRRLYRFQFEEPIHTVQEAREVLVAMTKV